MTQVRNLHIRVDREILADLTAVTRCPEAAVVRGGLQVLLAMVEAGALQDLKILCAQNVKPTGPKPTAHLNPNNQ